MRNWVFGSYNARGKKNRRNIKRLTPNDPSTAAITKRRRRAITRVSSSGVLFEKIDRIAPIRDGLDFGCAAAVPAGSVVGFAILSPLPGSPASLSQGDAHTDPHSN